MINTFYLDKTLDQEYIKEIKMANLDDLGNTSILDMSIDESLERIRQIRLSRNTKKVSTFKPRTSTVKKIHSTPMPEISKELAAKLLAKLGGLK